METQTCFHHTDRETGRACTRCGRPACPDCLVQASVGSQCFECVKAGAPSTSERLQRVVRFDTMLATKTIMAITIGAWVLMSLGDGGFQGGGKVSIDYALYGPAVHNGEWWRLFSYSLVHYGPIHILFNMLVFYQLGRILEPAAGHLRFTLIYVASVLGGAAGALLLDPHVPTGGASGGVFGVAAAVVVLMQRQGVRFWDTGWGPFLLLNLGLGFFLTGISIGGHIGGLIAGALTAEAMLRARRIGHAELGILGAVVVSAAAVVTSFALAAR